MRDRQIVVAVGVVVLIVVAVAGVATLGVFDGGPSDDTGPNESAADADGDDRTVALVTGQDDRIQAVATGGQTIPGESDLPADTELAFHVTSTGSEPWARTTTAEVRENGTFAATVGLSPAAWNETFRVSVVDAETDTELANVTGVVVASAYVSNDPAVAIGRTSGDVVYIDRAPNRSIRGKTDLPEGTELEVDFRSTGSDPFLKDFEATVDAEGTFGETVDFDDVPANTSFSTIVSYADNGTEIVDTPGVVVPPGQ